MDLPKRGGLCFHRRKKKKSNQPNIFNVSVYGKLNRQFHKNYYFKSFGIYLETLMNFSGYSCIKY